METWRDYYWAVIKRAFSGHFWTVEKITGGLFLFSPFIQFFPIPKTWADYWTNWGPVTFFGVVFVSTILVAFILAPYMLHKEEVAKRREVEALLPKPMETLGLEGESISFEDAAWRLLLEAEPLRESFESGIDSDNDRVWHCMVWLLHLSKLGEIKLYGLERGSRVYRPIDTKTSRYNFGVDEVSLKLSRADKDQFLDRVLSDRDISDYPWDDIRVLKTDVEKSLTGFNNGKIDEWAQDLPSD